ncbi:hypothetical protein, partial [Agitococcus lubricus]
MTLTRIYLIFNESNTGESSEEGQRAVANLVITEAGFVINEDGTISGGEGDFGKFAGDEAPYTGKKFLEPANPEDPWLLSDGIRVLFSLQGEVSIPAFDSYIDPSP